MHQPLHSFNRIEDKYVVPLALLRQFTNLVQENLSPSYADSETLFTLIQSLYFDSKDLKFFQHHFQHFPKRSKLRVRRYGPNGIWQNGVSFFEAKYKINGISNKQRFLITNDQYEGLLQNRPLIETPDFLALNRNLDSATLTRTFSEALHLIDSFQVVPKLNIEYQRLAFENESVRCTIDQNLKHRALDPIEYGLAAQFQTTEYLDFVAGMRRIFNCSTHFIVELKHSGSKPDWFVGFMNDNNIFESSFSKYCWGTIQMIESARSRPITAKITDSALVL